jgi:hypothetical protein
MAEFPEAMQIPDSTKISVAIPGWHINAHGAKCRNNFNLSYMTGAGRTTGEDIETTWAGTNALAPSVREMGPAARHDTLNDHWNGWNFRKIVGFRKTILCLVFYHRSLTIFYRDIVSKTVQRCLQPERQTNRGVQPIFCHVLSGNDRKMGINGHCLGSKPQGSKSL